MLSKMTSAGLDFQFAIALTLGLPVPGYIGITSTSDEGLKRGAQPLL